MKYNLIVNQERAIMLGIDNINQALIFDMLTSASTWAEPETVDNQVYYWVSRQTIANELKLLHLKPDTVYRHLKSLQKLGLIDYIKINKKDCIRLTKKGKSYIRKDDNSTVSEINPNDYVGNKSEKVQNSEINPTKFGNKSEKNSEINPTYPTTKNNPTTKDHKKEFSLQENPKKEKQIKQDLKDFVSKLKEEYNLTKTFLSKKIKISNQTIQELKKLTNRDLFFKYYESHISSYKQKDNLNYTKTFLNYLKSYIDAYRAYEQSNKDPYKYKEYLKQNGLFEVIEVVFANESQRVTPGFSLDANKLCEEWGIR